MTDKNPDATSASNAPNDVSSEIPDHAALEAAVRQSTRRSLPAPAASAKAHSIKTGAERKDNKTVIVYGKAQVMAVFANLDGNYTVKGYGERSHKGFGDFFLGMDASDEYDLQSRDINKAIQSITAEEGFALGLEGGRAAYGTANGGATKGGTSLFGQMFSFLRKASKTKASKTKEAEKRVEESSVDMLAAVATTLFGIPDGDLIITGPPRHDQGAPSRCPGDFNMVSGSLFKPEPEAGVAYLGKEQGKLLAKQTATLVARLRAAKTPPPGRLTRVLFDTIPPEDDDRLVRTLIGTMMGLLPTIQFNLVAVMTGLEGSGEIPRLRAKIAALGADPSYEQVHGMLKSAVYKAMQQEPTPEEVWRIAAHDHVISGETDVEVKKGDMVVVSIERATNADIKKKIEDISPIFGGLRTGRGRRPIHGCPGYAMAMGVIYGAVTVILQQPD